MIHITTGLQHLEMYTYKYNKLKFLQMGWF